MTKSDPTKALELSPTVGAFVDDTVDDLVEGIGVNFDEMNGGDPVEMPKSELTGDTH